MVSSKKKFNAFVDSIPDSKLTGISEGEGTLWRDVDFRLDLQGMTSGKPKKYNLQIQINSGTTISTLKRLAPQTVSTVIAPVDPPMSAQQLRDEFKRNSRWARR